MVVRILHKGLLPVLIAVTLTLTSAADPAVPPVCCVDRQFQARMSRIGGNAYPLTGNTVFIDGYQDMAYDYYGKKIGGIVYQRQPDGSMKNSTYLQDYNQKLQYVYTDGKCTIMKLDEPMISPCVPSNATFIGYGRLGYGTESLVTKSWEWTQRGLNCKTSVTDQGCVPIISAYYGTVDRVAIDVVEYVNGFKPGLDDPHALDTPKDTSMCTFVDDKDKSSPDSANSLVGKRSIF